MLDKDKAQISFRVKNAGRANKNFQSGDCLWLELETNFEINVSNFLNPLNKSRKTRRKNSVRVTKECDSSCGFCNKFPSPTNFSPMLNINFTFFYSIRLSHPQHNAKIKLNSLFFHKQCTNKGKSCLSFRWDPRHIDDNLKKDF